MHTAFELKKRMFQVTLEGQEVDPYGFLDWGPLDRLGVIIDRPVGALGAGLMILLAACAFYDTPGKKRRQRPLYPEIYLFHSGGPWGVFTNFDFWPDHKEIFLPNDPTEVLRAVNNRGITHLLVVDQPASAVDHRFKEPEAALDRIKHCWAYGANGSATHADIVIKASDASVLENYDGVLEIDQFLATVAAGDKKLLRVGSKTDEENSRSYELSNQRMARELDKNAPSHIHARARLDAARSAKCLVETYRTVATSTALEMLGRSTDRTTGQVGTR